MRCLMDSISCTTIFNCFAKHLANCAIGQGFRVISLNKMPRHGFFEGFSRDFWDFDEVEVEGFSAFNLALDYSIASVL